MVLDPIGVTAREQKCLSVSFQFQFGCHIGYVTLPTAFHVVFSLCSSKSSKYTAAAAATSFKFLLSTRHAHASRPPAKGNLDPGKLHKGRSDRTSIVSLIYQKTALNQCAATATGLPEELQTTHKVRSTKASGTLTFRLFPGLRARRRDQRFGQFGLPAVLEPTRAATVFCSHPIQGLSQAAIPSLSATPLKPPLAEKAPRSEALKPSQAR